ncbi:MAG: MarR family transcriptional regulator, partial [Xanthomonadales bacterium]|nr:MarR family transcriptional regulator [Xanthomonadales bacterium]
RTVGQIYAVLFIAERPLCADDIVERLGVSRSNVSMGIKELQSWNLLRQRSMPGDRREFFQTPEDIYAIVRTLVEERKKREIDPTLSVLRELLMRMPDSESERIAQARMLARRPQRQHGPGGGRLGRRKRRHPRQLGTGPSAPARCADDDDSIARRARGTLRRDAAGRGHAAQPRRLGRRRAAPARPAGG